MGSTEVIISRGKTGFPKEYGTSKSMSFDVIHLCGYAVRSTKDYHNVLGAIKNRIKQMINIPES